MKKLLIATACFMATIPSHSFADNTCKDTKYKLIDNTVTFGMSQSRAFDELKKKFSSVGSVRKKMNFIFVNFNNSYNNLKTIVVLSLENKVTRVMFVYSQEFTYKLGGVTELFKIMLKKMQDSYSSYEDMGYDEENKKATIEWAEHKGASLTLMASDENGEISYRVDCDVLEREIKDKQSKSINFGF